VLLSRWGTTVSSITDEIKARVDLVELIGRTVDLKRVGAYYRGLCPFHTEKTPSFYVRPQTQSWHCFGCNKSGTAFDWLMEREHVEFGEALRTLASMTGVAVPEHRDPEVEDQSRRLYSILQHAQTYYAAVLWGAAGVRSREYLARRGLTDETLKAFGIGYAPTGNGLLRYLEKDGFSEQELQASGVIGVTDDEGRPYDFFRDRVLFPIRDGQGRTVAFGGRSLDEGVTPKYLNSRDTLLFHKQETLFAFDLARKPMAQERQAVIVEGYMDAAMAHQHGYRNVVATLGTAVTERHLRLLRRQVDEIVLALDADAAGQAATWRALRTAEESLREGLKPVVTARHVRQRSVPARWVSLRVLALPGAKDPDELIRSDPRAWPTLVTEALPVTEFVLGQLQSRHDVTAAGGTAAAADEMTDALIAITNPIEQDHYANVVAEALRVAPETIRRIVKQKQQGAVAGSAPRPENTAVHGHADDDYLLALLMRLRAMPAATPVDLGDVEFVLAESRALYEAIGGETPPALEPYAERARRYLPDVERLSTSQLLRDLEETRLRIRKRRLELRLREISALGDDAEVRKLMGQLVTLAQDIGAIDQELLPGRERAGTR
jgi:DNA primase